MKRVQLISWCAALLLAVAAHETNTVGAPKPSELSVVAFNVLAPVWASPVWYPADMDPSLLDTVFRRERIMRFLRERRDTTDVFCLQEVVDGEFEHFREALGPGVDGVIAHNARDWWSNWVVPEIPWEPNGTAVFVNGRRLRQWDWTIWRSGPAITRRSSRAGILRQENTYGCSRSISTATTKAIA